MLQEVEEDKCTIAIARRVDRRRSVKVLTEVMRRL